MKCAECDKLKDELARQVLCNALLDDITKQDAETIEKQNKSIELLIKICTQAIEAGRKWKAEAMCERSVRLNEGRG